MFRKAPLFQFRHGDHTCVFYRSEDALMEVLTPYIAQGILKNERCFCAQKPEVLKRLVYDLRFLGMDPEKEIKRGALELHTQDEVYFPNQRFEPSALIEMLNQSIGDALEKGFSAFRSAGDLGWAASGQDVCDQVIEYENMVDQCFPHKPAIGLCQYAVDKFTPAMLDLVLENHKLQLPESKKNSTHSSLNIRYRAHRAEIVVDKTETAPHFYYVVQETERREVAGWGIARTFDSATANIEQLMNRRGAVSPSTRA